MPREYSFHLVVAATLAGVALSFVDSNAVASHASVSDLAVAPAASVASAALPTDLTGAPAIVSSEESIPAIANDADNSATTLTPKPARVRHRRDAAMRTGKFRHNLRSAIAPEVQPGRPG